MSAMYRTSLSHALAVGVTQLSSVTVRLLSRLACSLALRIDRAQG